VKLKVIIILSLFYLGNTAQACQLAPLNSCRAEEKVQLEKTTFTALEKTVLRYQDLLDRNIKKPQKVKNSRKANGAAGCFDYHFSGYYFKAIREFAKKNRGLFCSAHLPLLYSSIHGLVDRKSSETALVKNEKAKMDLLEQAMNVSEALLYFKNKHTK
jgi:hypothetical protein